MLFERRDCSKLIQESIGLCVVPTAEIIALPTCLSRGDARAVQDVLAAVFEWSGREEVRRKVCDPRELSQLVGPSGKHFIEELSSSYGMNVDLNPDSVHLFAEGLGQCQPLRCILRCILLKL